MVLTFLNPFFDSLFSPLFTLGPFPALVIISFLISLMIVVVYKLVTDQNLMKQLKDEQKELQKEMKELREHPEKLMKVQQDLMQTNMKYMMQSMRPTLFTILPILVIFGWLSSTLAFQPLAPGEDFTLTVDFQDAANGLMVIDLPEGLTLEGSAEREVNDGNIVYTLRGDEGEYRVDFLFQGSTYNKEVILTKDHRYVKPVKAVNDEYIKDIKANNEKLIVLNLFGWQLGWLGTYILLSIAFSIALRRILKVH